jgi:hypothetical protein
VAHDELAADPLGTVESVYARFGLPFTGRAADAMHARLASPGLEQGSGDRAAHRYSLAEFGLTAGQVTERFSRLRG